MVTGLLSGYDYTTDGESCVRDLPVSRKGDTIICMRIIFVRHGESDYSHDCLTEKGRQQAAAVAERLADEGISAVYTSPNGRAYETAVFTAERLGLAVTTSYCLREIMWGGPGIPCSGKPWELGRLMLGEGFDFRSADWREHPYFEYNSATECCRVLSADFDAFLPEHGYRHEGRGFFCEKGSAETLVMFAHGASIECLLAHILDLPFPYVSYAMQHDPASLTMLDFPVSDGAWVFPKLELFNDCSHLSR